MLKSLIKYDLKYIYKQLIIFYIIIFCCAIIARLTNFETTSFWWKFLHEFAQGAAFGFSFGALVNGSIRTWVRFRQSLYGDESYLTHTLPVSKSTLWASKFLTSIIIVATTLLSFILALAIMFWSDDFYRHIGVTDIAAFWKIAIILILAIFLQVVFILQVGFTGILLGHRANNRRHLLSVLSGFGIYLLGGMIIIACTFIWGHFNHSVDLLLRGKTNEYGEIYFDEQGTPHSDVTFQADPSELLSGISLFYVILIGATFVANDKLLKSGVNVD